MGQHSNAPSLYHSWDMMFRKITIKDLKTTHKGYMFSFDGLMHASRSVGCDEMHLIHCLLRANISPCYVYVFKNFETGDLCLRSKLIGTPFFEVERNKARLFMYKNSHEIDHSINIECDGTTIVESDINGNIELDKLLI